MEQDTLSTHRHQQSGQDLQHIESVTASSRSTLSTLTCCTVINKTDVTSRGLEVTIVVHMMH